MPPAAQETVPKVSFVSRMAIAEVGGLTDFKRNYSMEIL